MICRPMLLGIDMQRSCFYQILNDEHNKMVQFGELGRSPLKISTSSPLSQLTLIPSTSPFPLPLDTPFPPLLSYPTHRLLFQLLLQISSYLVIVISGLLKRYLKPKCTRAPAYSRALVVVIAANWDTARVFIKATGDLSQPGNSPVCNSIVFTCIIRKNMMSSVENFLNRRYPRFVSTTTTTTASAATNQRFFQRVVKRSSGPISRGPGGDRVVVKVGVIEVNDQMGQGRRV